MRKERLKYDIEFLTDQYKSASTLLIAIFSGEAALYAVISGEKPIQVLILAIVGLLLAAGIFINQRRTAHARKLKLDELERME